MGTEISRELVAQDFADAMKGKLDDFQIEAAQKAMLAADTSYGVNGSIDSFIFYLQFQVNVTGGGKQFNGKAGGVSTPGAGAFFGTLYTDDIDRLYSETKHFSFVSTPMYLGIQFFDGDSNFLGHVEAGAVSIVVGGGGGSGSWS